MALTDPKIRALKSLDKPYKVIDSGGLYILVKPGGAKHWYLRYRFGGKETRIAFGAYPAVTLAAAREKREEVRRMLRLTARGGESRRRSFPDTATYRQ
ncbi:DUF4102 domain-containing protein [Salmonella enterica subsp. enterica serovar Livingstone]|nr:DUF4102 domain-containing protein [Salmonella enterica subsp. enterica serovar Livingstone]